MTARAYVLLRRHLSVDGYIGDTSPDRLNSAEPRDQRVARELPSHPVKITATGSGFKEGRQHRLKSPAGGQDVYGVAVDRLIASPGTEVLDVGGHRLALLAEYAGQGGQGPASRPADKRLVIDAEVKAKGPFEPVCANPTLTAAAGRSRRKA
jgi:hypothetical protein